MTVEVALKTILNEAAVPFKQNRKSFILACPRCGKSGKLYIRKVDGRFVCWVCKEKEQFFGKAEWVLSEILAQPLQDLRHRLYGQTESVGPNNILSIQLIDFFDETDEVPVFAQENFIEIEPHPDFLPLSDARSRPGREYLISRGISNEIQDFYDIQYWPARGSVVFPVKVNGKLVGWQTRIAGGTEIIDPETGETGTLVKSNTSIGLKKDKLLMFQDRLPNSDHAILAEGPVDAIKGHYCGGNVASLGKAVSKYQLDLILHSGVKKLYLGLDPDAFNECQSILKQVAGEIELYDMRPPTGDLGGMSFDAVLDLYKTAPRITKNYVFVWLDKELYNGF
jgi:DNA primase